MSLVELKQFCHITEEGLINISPLLDNHEFKKEILEVCDNYLKEMSWKR